MDGSRRFMYNRLASRDRDLERKRHYGCTLILLAQLLERVAYYSIVGNMVYQLNSEPYQWSSYNAASTVLLLSGFTFVSALLGGFLADSALGKFWTILLGYALYLVAYAGFPMLYASKPISVYSVNDTVPAFCQYFTLPRKRSHPSNLTASEMSLQMCDSQENITTLAPITPATLIPGTMKVNLLQERCGGYILLLVIGVSIGSGLVKSVVPPFGADQEVRTGNQMVRSYFNKFYWVINSGTFFAYVVVAYVQQNLTLFVGYLIPYTALLTSAVVFASGYSFYYHRPTIGNVFVDLVRVLWEALVRSCRLFCRPPCVKDSNRFEEAGGSCCCCCCCGPRSKKRKNTDVSLHDSSEDVSSKGISRPNDTPPSPTPASPDGGDIPGSTLNLHIEDSSETETSHQLSQSWLAKVRCLDLAKLRYGGSHHESLVDDVRVLGWTVFLMLFLVPYWLVYYQMESEFLIQGLHMRLVLHKSGTEDGRYLTVPVAWLQLFDVATVLLIIPIFNKFLYPYVDRNRRAFTLYVRMVIGMCFSLAAVLVAAVVEIRRYQFVREGNIIQQMIGHTWYNAADMSVFWQVFQYAFIGVGEVFTCVAGLEFAYSQAPRTMQSLISGIFYFMSGISSLLGIALINIFHGIFFFDEDFGNPNCQDVPCHDGRDTCDCQLANYFFVLAGIQLCGIVGFLLVYYVFLRDDLRTPVCALTATPGRSSDIGVSIPQADGVPRNAQRVSNSPGSSSSGAAVLPHPF